MLALDLIERDRRHAASPVGLDLGDRGVLLLGDRLVVDGRRLEVAQERITVQGVDERERSGRFRAGPARSGANGADPGADLVRKNCLFAGRFESRMRLFELSAPLFIRGASADNVTVSFSRPGQSGRHQREQRPRALPCPPRARGRRSFRNERESLRAGGLRLPPLGHASKTATSNCVGGHHA